MMTKDLRREQILVLRFEKTLADQAKRKMAGKKISRSAIAVSLAGLFTAGTASAAKLGSDAPIQVYNAVQEALPKTGEISGEILVSLAEIIGKGHALVESLAIDASFKLLEVSGGTDKDPPVEMVKSILGL
jgi:hypothetical protein